MENTKRNIKVYVRGKQTSHKVEKKPTNLRISKFQKN